MLDTFTMFAQADEMTDTRVPDEVWDEFLQDGDDYEIQNVLLFKEDCKRKFHMSLSELHYLYFR